MKAIVIAIALLAQACSTAKADGDKSMSCAPIAFGSVVNGDRCESAEAVCFLTPQGGISCLKK